MPSDVAAQVAHTIPKVKGVAVAQAPSPLTLNNLDQLNTLGGRDVWLTSEKGIQAYPKWFYGVAPDENHQTKSVTSCAVVTVDKGKGILDAFYFYFFAFNHGNAVLGIEFGHHVGDWEHNMIRFQDGIPQAVYFSQHASSESFTYAAVEKMGKRPVAYVAKGSHAVYGTTGYGIGSLPRPEWC
jgi:Vacuolar protein sorting-associated protein 62